MLAQTLRHGVLQISFGNQTAKDTVLRAGLDIKERHYECVELSGSRPQNAHPAGPPPALVTCKMPYEMPDATIKLYCQNMAMCHVYTVDATLSPS